MKETDMNENNFNNWRFWFRKLQEPIMKSQCLNFHPLFINFIANKQIKDTIQKIVT